MDARARTEHRTLVLLDNGPAHLPPDVLRDGGSVLVAGSSRLRLALAPLSLPGARVIWTDFQRSASLRSLRADVQRQGGIDRLVLVGSAGGSGLAQMSAILTLLPLFRKGRGAEVVLCPSDAGAAQSLRTFLNRLAPRLRSDGIAVRWQEPLAA